ncbi:unnamed protein product [Closterium sp. NIES-65]|nr:unnamed protein product [Closterium sp. NIES-65]
MSPRQKYFWTKVPPEHSRDSEGNSFATTPPAFTDAALSLLIASVCRRWRCLSQRHVSTLLVRENVAVSRQDLANAVSCFSNLTHLHLCDGSVETLDDAFLSHLASACPKLTVLHVGSRITKDAEIQERKHLHPITETGLDRLFQGCSQLEVISFDRLGSALHPSVVFPASFFHLSQLRTLVLPDASALIAPGFSTLSSLSSIRITSLNLGFHHLANLVQLPRLTSLAISYDPEVEEERPETFSVAQLPFMKSLQLEGEASPFIMFLPSGLPCSRLERLVIAGSHFLAQLPDDLGEILPCLRELNLSWCSKLTRLPRDFTSLTQLESLTITSCRLSSLPDSFGRLSTLKTLVLRSLPLANLPDSFGRLESLETFTMYMLSVTELPEPFAYLPSLRTLLMVGCREFRQLPANFGRLRGLTTLCMVKLPLIRLPEGLEGMDGIQRMFPDDVFNPLQLPGSLFELTSLTRLDMDLVSDEKLPEGIGKLNQLRHLSIHCCFNLREVPESLTGLTNLNTLTIGMCSELVSLPKKLDTLIKLKRLELTGCHPSMWLNGSFISMPSSLESLSLGSYNQTIVLPNLPMLPNLKKLTLNLVDVAGGEANLSEPSALPMLQHLELVLAEYATELAFPLASLPQLRVLVISRAGNIEKLPGSISTDLMQLRSLQIEHAAELKVLPETISQLRHLTSLEVHAPKLASLPTSIGALSRLRELDLSDCSALENLPASLTQLGCLNKLKLENTAIRSLPGNFAQLTRLKSLDLALDEVYHNCALMYETVGLGA